MIYILSLNPSIDYHMLVEDFSFGKTNRSLEESMYVGGKGINVASVLSELGSESTLLGFVGGFTGKQINEHIAKITNIDNMMIETDVASRTNVKLKGKFETEINAKGELIKPLYIDKIEAQLNNLNKGDVLVITGSLANGMDPDWYTQVSKKMYEKGVYTVVDIASKELLDICQYRPLLVKPNINELESFFDVEIKDREDVLIYAHKLIDKGAHSVLVSRGGEGSILVTSDRDYETKIPQGTVINTVGSGDSMVAGFIYSYTLNRDIKKAYKMAAAAGSATAYSKHLGSKKLIYELYDKIVIGE